MSNVASTLNDLKISAMSNVPSTLNDSKPEDVATSNNPSTLNDPEIFQLLACIASNSLHVVTKHIQPVLNEDISWRPRQRNRNMDISTQADVNALIYYIAAIPGITDDCLAVCMDDWTAQGKDDNIKLYLACNKLVPPSTAEKISDAWTTLRELRAHIMQLPDDFDVATILGDSYVVDAQAKMLSFGIDKLKQRIKKKNAMFYKFKAIIPAEELAEELKDVSFNEIYTAMSSLHKLLNINEPIWPKNSIQSQQTKKQLKQNKKKASSSFNHDTFKQIAEQCNTIRAIIKQPLFESIMTDTFNDIVMTGDFKGDTTKEELARAISNEPDFAPVLYRFLKKITKMI
ncbi:hypothetical protein K474DRAFT_1676278 [Panus rudis PR-1116 ss-1]|nr:hypothetical protein K474DRAFT_1676278 [Panus rudis PR-1116 ss-1]